MGNFGNVPPGGFPPQGTPILDNRAFAPQGQAPQSFGVDANAAASGPPPVDINALMNHVDEVDPNASMADMPPPPPRGTYRFKVSLHITKNTKIYNDGLPGEAKSNDKGIPFFTVPGVMYTMLSEGNPWDGRKFYKPNISTLVGGKRTSTADDLLEAIRGTKGIGMTAPQKRQALLELIKQEPIIEAAGDWEAVFEERQDASGNWKNSPLRGMANFPGAAQGKPTPVSVITKTERGQTLTEAVNTEFVIDRFWPLKRGPISQGLVPQAGGEPKGPAQAFAPPAGGAPPVMPQGYGAPPAPAGYPPQLGQQAAPLTQGAPQQAFPPQGYLPPTAQPGAPAPMAPAPVFPGGMPPQGFGPQGS